MASGPLDESRLASLQAERDALAARCAEAERQVADLTARIAAADARIADLESAATGMSETFFVGADESRAGLARDGSDPRVLPLVLGATAVVAGMVAVLAFVNGNLSTTFGYAMVLTTVVLGWAALRTRVPEVRVSVDGGVVHVVRGESTYRFDLRQDGTRIDMVGQPGDSYWQVQFHRRGMDDFVVDADMVDAEDFVRRLREYRPDL